MKKYKVFFGKNPSDYFFADNSQEIVSELLNVDIKYSDIKNVEKIINLPAATYIRTSNDINLRNYVYYKNLRWFDAQGNKMNPRIEILDNRNEDDIIFDKNTDCSVFSMFKKELELTEDEKNQLEFIF
jgi:hypothetical protein